MIISRKIYMGIITWRGRMLQVLNNSYPPKKNYRWVAQRLDRGYTFIGSQGRELEKMGLIKRHNNNVEVTDTGRFVSECINQIDNIIEKNGKQ